MQKKKRGSHLSGSLFGHGYSNSHRSSNNRTLRRKFKADGRPCGRVQGSKGPIGLLCQLAEVALAAISESGVFVNHAAIACNRQTSGLLLALRNGDFRCFFDRGGRCCCNMWKFDIIAQAPHAVNCSSQIPGSSARDGLAHSLQEL